MSYSAEEKSRILFLANEVMKRTDDGACMEIKNGVIEINVWNGKNFPMLKFIYPPIRERDVYKALQKLDWVLDKEKEHALQEEMEKEEEDDQLREQQ